MSRRARSARGKIVDFGALAAQNEKTRAVGNVPMNARGDRLDAKGNVKTKVEDIARVTQTLKPQTKQTAVSDPVPVSSQSSRTATSKPVQEPQEEVLDNLSELEQEMSQPEAISKITRTRNDGSKYVEIEYDDGSIETKEVTEE